MEHRRFKRNEFHSTVKLITTDDRIYPASIIDVCPMGLRVINKIPLPARIKVVNVEPLITTGSRTFIGRMRMFVVHRDGKDGLIMGLCLVHETDRIDFERLLLAWAAN